MSARTGSTVVAVLRPASLVVRGVSADAVTGADTGANDGSMEFEFGLIELTPIELKTEDGVALTVQYESDQSSESHPGAQALLLSQPEPPTLRASISAGSEPLR